MLKVPHIKSMGEWAKDNCNNLESYPMREYILGSGAPGTNAVGNSGAINGMKR